MDFNEIIAPPPLDLWRASQTIAGLLSARTHHDGMRVWHAHAHTLKNNFSLGASKILDKECYWVTLPTAKVAVAVLPFKRVWYDAHHAEMQLPAYSESIRGVWFFNLNEMGVPMMTERMGVVDRYGYLDRPIDMFWFGGDTATKSVERQNGLWANMTFHCWRCWQFNDTEIIEELHESK